MLGNIYLYNLLSHSSESGRLQWSSQTGCPAGRALWSGLVIYTAVDPTADIPDLRTPTILSPELSPAFPVAQCLVSESYSLHTLVSETCRGYPGLYNLLSFWLLHSFNYQWPVDMLLGYVFWVNDLHHSIVTLCTGQLWVICSHIKTKKLKYSLGVG